MIVLVVGGSGTLGSYVVPLLLEDPQVERVRILSRSEHKQAEMAEKLGSPKVDFILGDIRDPWRVKWAMSGVHQVYHFAATKRVEQSEYNPDEAKSVNIDGTQNIIRGILETPTVEKAIYTSTDKACAPFNMYGGTKFVAERMWIQANVGKHRSRFSACRYGNVLASNGSVVATWKRRIAEGKTITVTNGDMTRFLITPSKAAEFVVSAMRDMDGGEVFVPRMKSTTMMELGLAMNHIVGNVATLEIVDERPGEKQHEVLISQDQVPLTTWDGKRLIQWPAFNLYPVRRYGEPVKEEFNSFNAERFTEGELQELCRNT